MAMCGITSSSRRVLYTLKITTEKSEVFSKTIMDMLLLYIVFNILQKPQLSIVHIVAKNSRL